MNKFAVYKLSQHPLQMTLRLARIDDEILRCEMTLLGMEVGNEYDWRAELRQVVAAVNVMRGTGDAWYFPMIKSTLTEVIQKIIEMDLEDKWIDVRFLLQKCIFLFSMLTVFPDHYIAATFRALHDGLESEILPIDKWRTILKKDEKIRRIMHSVGRAIQSIPPAGIIAIIGEPGIVQMKSIASILSK